MGPVICPVSVGSWSPTETLQIVFAVDVSAVVGCPRADATRGRPVGQVDRTEVAGLVEAAEQADGLAIAERVLHHAPWHDRVGIGGGSHRLIVAWAVAEMLTLPIPKISAKNVGLLRDAVTWIVSLGLPNDDVVWVYETVSLAWPFIR